MSKPRVNLRRLDSGSLKAAVEVTLETEVGPITLQGFKVIHEDGKGPWVSVPTREYVRDDSKHYQKLVDLSKPAARAIFGAILEAYAEQQAA
jgi:DNA-binding cell septation regulator SpoVG